jgi:uncharacterized membrane protein YqhA
MWRFTRCVVFSVFWLQLINEKPERHQSMWRFTRCFAFLCLGVCLSVLKQINEKPERHQSMWRSRGALLACICLHLCMGMCAC